MGISLDLVRVCVALEVEFEGLVWNPFGKDLFNLG